MNIVRKGLWRVGLAAFILGLFLSGSAWGQVTVTAEGTYTDTTVNLKIYADTASEELGSFGVMVTDPNNGTLSNPTPAVDNTWELQSTGAAAGQAIIVGGKLDQTNPTSGVSGSRVLLGSVDYARDPQGDAPPFGLSLALGKAEPFANFVNTEGIELDASIVFNAVADVTVQVAAYLLWTDGSSQGHLWSLDEHEAQIPGMDRTFGPHSGWLPQCYQKLPDGTAKLLWSEVTGKGGLWTFDADGVHLAGDVNWQTAGWTARSYQKLPDGTARLLWSDAANIAVLWELDENDVHVSENDRSWGPFTDWWPLFYQKLADGTARMLWTRVDGRASLWTFDADGNHLGGLDRSWGPFTDWMAQSYQQLADGTAKLLWSKVSGKGSLWTFDANGVHLPGDITWITDGWTSRSYNKVE